MKQVKLSKGLLVFLLPVCAIGLALMLSLFLPGASYSESTEIYGMTYEASASVSLFSLLSGFGELVSESNGFEATVEYSGGLSIFGFVALLLAIASIVVLVVAQIKSKEQKYNLVLVILGIAFAIVSALAMLLVLVAGTDLAVEVYGTSTASPFTETFEDFGLGIGAILWSVLCLGGGVASLVILLLDMKKGLVEGASAE